MLKNEVIINRAGSYAPPDVPLEFEGHTVRMRMDDEGNPWWVARDVCEVMGIPSRF